MSRRLRLFLAKLQQVDATLSRWLARGPSTTSERSWLNWLAHLGAHLGDSWLWAVIAAVTVRQAKLGGAQTSRQRLLWGWLLSLVAAALLTGVIKGRIQRPRPGAGVLLYGGGADRHSFPSGHAMRMGVITVWASGLWPQWQRYFPLLALWVCWSRVRLGIHYVGDVLVGFLLGRGIALCLRWLTRRS